MTGLVLELQRDALNSEITVSNLLRKVFVISKKLNIVEIEGWVNKELNGYLTGDEIPEYRIVYGEVKAWNPYRGWIPAFFQDTQMAELFSKRNMSLSIGEIESLTENEAHELQVSFSPDMESYLIRNTRLQFKPSLIIGKTGIINILETVRNNVLDWALELERQGILGEGMSFSPEEKKLAHQTNITNNIGSMHNSQIQQDSAGATQSLAITETDTTELKKFVEELKNAMAGFQLAQEQSQDLKEAIATLEIQVNSAKPKNVIIHESLHTVRNIIEGMTGSVIASGLICQLGLFLPAV
ncbi:hypothetical protein BCS42_12760 [Crenothrix sp. D3]|nr:hypothetical protein BCS42_12760 [Crenothrix sp. D3]